MQVEAGKRAQVLEEIKKWVDVTESLGAPHPRVFAGKLQAGATVQRAIEWTVDTLTKGCEYAGKKGITLGMEDHEGITQNVDAYLEIVNRVDSPFFGINLDITNFIATAKPMLTRKLERPFLTPHIRTSVIAFKMGKPQTWTAFGKFLPAPITKVSCPPNMKEKKIPPPPCRNSSTKSKRFLQNIPEFDP